MVDVAVILGSESDRDVAEKAIEEVKKIIADKRNGVVNCK